MRKASGNGHEGRRAEHPGAGVGRLGGAGIGRTEFYRGRVPLHPAPTSRTATGRTTFRPDRRQGVDLPRQVSTNAGAPPAAETPRVRPSGGGRDRRGGGGRDRGDRGARRPTTTPALPADPEADPMLIPRRVKYHNSITPNDRGCQGRQQGHVRRSGACRPMEPTYVTNRQIRVRPYRHHPAFAVAARCGSTSTDRPLTKKPAEPTWAPRRGSPEWWVNVKPGRVMFRT